VQQAAKIFQDGIASDIIKIGNLVTNKERFVKRRQRLVGPSGQTLKAIELLTGCYVLVQGNTVSAMGSYQGLKQVRKVVEDCMHNIHPVYNIKALMIKRELQKDPEMAHENWDRFLPKFKAQRPVGVKRKKKRPIEPKKKRALFPPPQTPRKVDLEMETGEYFMKETERKKIKAKAKADQQDQRMAVRTAEKEARYVAPKETKKRAAISAEKATGGPVKDREEKRDLQAAVAKLKARALKPASTAPKASKAQDFILQGGKRPREEANDVEKVEQRPQKRRRAADDD